MTEAWTNWATTLQKERGAEKPNLKKREGSNERDVNTNVEKNKPSIIIPTKKKKKIQSSTAFGILSSRTCVKISAKTNEDGKRETGTVTRAQVCVQVWKRKRKTNFDTCHFSSTIYTPTFPTCLETNHSNCYFWYSLSFSCYFCTCWRTPSLLTTRAKWINPSTIGEHHRIHHMWLIWDLHYEINLPYSQRSETTS